MGRPANPAGVIVAVVFAVGLVVLGVSLGLNSETRRGIPIWLLLSIGVPCFGWVALQAWRKPRRPRR